MVPAVVVPHIRFGLTVSKVEVVHSLFTAAGGSETQIPKVPLLSLPYSQNIIHIVEPGVNPVLSIMGIKPLGLSSSSHSISVIPEGGQVPEYIAIPPSVITPVCESILICPEAGTVTLNQTSPPEKLAHPGAGIPACCVAPAVV
jgi:hypothetical protein